MSFFVQHFVICHTSHPQVFQLVHEVLCSLQYGIDLILIYTSLIPDAEIRLTCRTRPAIRFQLGPYTHTVNCVMCPAIPLLCRAVVA
jgi:hypothetical protein